MECERAVFTITLSVGDTHRKTKLKTTLRRARQKKEMATDVISAQAKHIVQSIGKRLGVLRKELMYKVEIWSPSARREIVQSWLDMETALSNAVANLKIRFVGEIYGSGVRCVFEFLQNADDNSF